jgi:nickel-type superoxide dismutase maturation protease
VFVALALGIAVAYGFLRWRPFRVEVEGSSMAPTLESGDWAVAVAPRRVRRGEIVVVEHPERPGFDLVKRVTAVSGDRAPSGVLLGVGWVWVEGDHADGSTDSRAFGPVRMEGVRGIVRAVWRPRSRRRWL